MLLNLLTNVIIWVHTVIKDVFSQPDYKIMDTSMEYFLDNEKAPIPDELDEFWKEEYDEWDGETESFFKTLNYTEYKNTKIPGNVNKTIVRVDDANHPRGYRVELSDTETFETTEWVTTLDTLRECKEVVLDKYSN